MVLFGVEDVTKLQPHSRMGGSFARPTVPNALAPLSDYEPMHLLWRCLNYSTLFARPIDVVDSADKLVLIVGDQNVGSVPEVQIPRLGVTVGKQLIRHVGHLPSTL